MKINNNSYKMMIIFMKYQNIQMLTFLNRIKIPKKNRFNGLQVSWKLLPQLINNKEYKQLKKL